jgi:diguanylate cyclase (GGDEF)-like protein
MNSHFLKYSPCYLFALRFMFLTLDPISINLACAAFLAFGAVAVFVLRGHSERVSSMEFAAGALLIGGAGISLQGHVMAWPCLVAAIVLMSAGLRAMSGQKERTGTLLCAFGVGSLCLLTFTGAARELSLIGLLLVASARWLEGQLHQDSGNAVTKKIKQVSLLCLSALALYLIGQGITTFTHYDDVATKIVSRMDFALGLCACALLIVWTVQTTARSEAHRRIQLDPLTGLASRDYLLQHSERWMKDHPLSLALMVIDIDHFRTINEKYGYQVGDSVLRHVGKRLKESVRKDTLVARYGGEEFGLIVPVGDRIEAAKVAERLRFEIEQSPFFLGAEAIQITVSVGVTLYDQKVGLNNALVKADAYLHQAKDEGRNRVVTAFA